MRTKALGLACLMLVAGGAEAGARCLVPTIHAINNQTVDGSMTVSSGAPCRIKLKTSSGPTHGAHIVQRPSQGTATIDGRNIIVYRSRSGFVGGDSFTYARTGEGRGGDAVTRTVRVAVTVTP
jgi:hypothetical protein